MPCAREPSPDPEVQPIDASSWWPTFSSPIRRAFPPTRAPSRFTGAATGAGTRTDVAPPAAAERPTRRWVSGPVGICTIRSTAARFTARPLVRVL